MLVAMVLVLPPPPPLLVLVLVLVLPTPACSRGRKRHSDSVREAFDAMSYAPPPTTRLLDLDPGAFDLARDGSGPVTYGIEDSTDVRTPTNGALFDRPLKLEKCAGDWRCAKRDKSNPAHWEMQSRNDNTAFCDFPVVSADELTAEYFQNNFLDKTPVIIRRSPDGGKEPFRNKAVNDLLARKGVAALHLCLARRSLGAEAF